MTLRQRQILTLVAADLKAGRQWLDRVLSGFPGVRITWEEMLWLNDFERQATLTRIEAAFIVHRATL